MFPSGFSQAKMAEMGILEAGYPAQNGTPNVLRSESFHSLLLDPSQQFPLHKSLAYLVPSWCLLLGGFELICPPMAW
jgi:hypothetical protein